MGRASRYRAGGGAGVTLAAWEKVTGWGTKQDPGSVDSGATTEDNGDITLSLDELAATQVDGVQKNRLHYRKLITAVWSDFDYTKDIVEMRVDFASIPISATLHKIGVAFGITEGATIGSRLGTMFGIYPNTSTIFRTCSMTSSGQNATSDMTAADIPLRMYATHQLYRRTDGTVRVGARVGRVANDGDYESSAIAANPANHLTAAGVANWCFEVGHIQISATAPGADHDIDLSVYVRRLRTSEILPTT